MEIKKLNPEDMSTPRAGVNVDRNVVNSTDDLEVDEENAYEELKDGEEEETEEPDSDSMEGDDAMDEEDENDESDDVSADDNESEEGNEDVEEKSF